MAARYYELVLDADEKVAKAFIKGFISGRKIKSGVFFSSEHHVSSGHLVDLIHHHGTKQLLCRASLRAAIVSAVKQAPKELNMTLSTERVLAGASFEFKCNTYSKKIAASLKRLFRSLPQGLSLSRFEPEENFSPDAKGAEGYAPLHEYQYRGKGRVSGDIDKVISFHGKLSDHEFVDVDDIHLAF